MKTYVFKSEQFIAKPLGEVFEFFSKPENLAVITPPSLGFKMITPSPVLMKKGAVIDYTIRIFGLPLKWQTLITEYEIPLFFVDTQKRGPYALWEHTHRFEEAQGGVRIHDEVRYAIGFGILGRLAHFLFVKKDIGNIFRYRNSKIAEIFSLEAVS